MVVKTLTDEFVVGAFEDMGNATLFCEHDRFSSRGNEFVIVGIELAWPSFLKDVNAKFSKPRKRKSCRGPQDGSNGIMRGPDISNKSTAGGKFSAP